VLLPNSKGSEAVLPLQRYGDLGRERSSIGLQPSKVLCGLAYVGGRAADPLHSSRVDSKSLGNLANALGAPGDATLTDGELVQCCGSSLALNIATTAATG
jgi:hypothetical protein